MKHLFGYAVTFFISALLIYQAVQYIKAVWPVLLVVGLIAGGVIIAYNIWKNRPKW